MQATSNACPLVAYTDLIVSSGDNKGNEQGIEAQTGGMDVPPSTRSRIKERQVCVGIFIIKTKQAFSGRETTWGVKIMQLICYALNTWLKVVKEK